MLESSSTNGYRRKRPQKVELQGGTQIREGRKTLKYPNNNSVKNTLKRGDQGIWIYIYWNNMHCEGDSNNKTNR